MKGREVSSETRAKQRLAKLGRKLPDEVKQKMKGRTPWNKGISGHKHTLATRLKMSNTRKGVPTPWLLEYVTGENHYNWRGGISKIDRRCRVMAEYKEWRSQVFERDNYACTQCGIKGYITAHHIKGFAKILREHNILSTKEARNCEELWDLTNGITLCELCHSQTDNYKGRAQKILTPIS